MEPSLPKPSAQNPPTEGVLESLTELYTGGKKKNSRSSHAIVGEEEPETKDWLR